MRRFGRFLILFVLLFILNLHAKELEHKEKQLQDKLKKDPNNVELLLALSDVYFEMGGEAKDKDDKIRFFTQGKDCAKKAIKINNNSAEAHFLYGANLGTLSQMKGFLNVLPTIPELKEEFDTALKLDPNHFKGLIARANLYYELPGLLGGDLDKSVRDLKKALELKPNSARARLDLGRAYIKKREYEKARNCLNKAINMQNPLSPQDFPEHKSSAQKLLKEIEDK